jgi:mRNA interferase HicA
VKKIHLEKQLRALGWRFLREGGSHEIWTNGSHNIPIPRHREIREGTARAILKEALFYNKQRGKE